MADNNKAGTGLHRCSFCGRTENQVNYLIPSQSGVYICDNCVFACSQLIDDYESSIKTKKRFLCLSFLARKKSKQHLTNM